MDFKSDTGEKIINSEAVQMLLSYQKKMLILHFVNLVFLNAW